MRLNRFGWLVLGVAVIVMMLGGVACQSAPAAATNTMPKEISTSQALNLRNAGAFILDVRQPEEWNEYHVPGSTLIPLGELESRVKELPRDKQIVVVCRSGNRSATGRDILLKAGFQVTSLAGGLSQWKAAGYPTVTGP